MVTQRGAYGLMSICYLTASTHYSADTLILECYGLSQFQEETGRPSVHVREINLIAYPPLVQRTENTPTWIGTQAAVVVRQSGPVGTVAQKAH